MLVKYHSSLNVSYTTRTCRSIYLAMNSPFIHKRLTIHELSIPRLQSHPFFTTISCLKSVQPPTVFSYLNLYLYKASVTSEIMRLPYILCATLLPSVFAAPLNWGATADHPLTTYHNRIGGFMDGVHSTDYCHDGSIMDYDHTKCVPFTSFP